MRAGKLIANAVAASALVIGSAGVAAATPATGAPTGSCKQAVGVVHVQPGLAVNAHNQKVAMSGDLVDCTGGAATGARFVAHFKDVGRLTCNDVLAGGLSVSGTMSFNWAPHVGHSNGTVTVALGANGMAHVSGTITRGLGLGTTFAGDATATPVFKAAGTPCSPANRLKTATIALTSPLVFS